MLEFAEKVTLTSWMCTPEDLDRLRAVGFTDEEILEITLVVCHYAFMTRLTDALGVEVHPQQVAPELMDSLLATGVVPT